jgi:NitT/TauT family transport system ATP-binding protein
MKDKHTAGRLVLEKVSHSYGAVPVLNNLSLCVNPGEIVVLVGPSGCGKTTILNLLSGHIEPISGNIQREGIIRTVYQYDSLFPWLTVSENISIGLRFIEDEARRRINKRYSSC